MQYVFLLSAIVQLSLTGPAGAAAGIPEIDAALREIDRMREELKRLSDGMNVPKRPAQTPNYGVDFKRIEPGVTIINGKRVSRSEALQAVRGASFRDDSKQPRLTVIGSPEQCRLVLADIQTRPELAGVRTSWLVQEYRPTDWAVSEAGFARNGQPSIYLQRADGKVLYRLSKYSGPTALVDAIRKVDPSYDPTKDPNPANPLGTCNPYCLAAGGGLAAYMLLKAKNQPPENK